MAENYRYVVCLGTNHEADKNLEAAKEKMEISFPGIQWGKVIQTPAEGEGATGTYSNLAAVFHATTPCNVTAQIIKSIERACGRTQSDKEKGIIPIDIDLLMCDNEILKPADMTKEYVKAALQTIELEDNM